MSVDTPRYGFHNSNEAGIPLTPRKTSLEQALEEAVSRALRDNLAPLQRTADELHHAYADLVAACGSSRPSNALPALLRAQTAAAALAAGLSVLSNFVAVALNPRDQQASEEHEFAGVSAAAALEEPQEAPEEVADEETAQVSARETVEVEEPAGPAAAPPPPEPELEWVEEPEEVLNAANRIRRGADSCTASGSRGRRRNLRTRESAQGRAGTPSSREPRGQSRHARHQTIAAERSSPGP